MAYTPEQIRQFAQQNGWVNQDGSLAGDGYQGQQASAGGIYGAAQQYGVDPSQLDQAFGWNPNTSVQWAAANGKAGSGNWDQAITDYRLQTQPWNVSQAQGGTAQPMSGSTGQAQNMSQPNPMNFGQASSGYGQPQQPASGYGTQQDTQQGWGAPTSGGYGGANSNPGTDGLASSIGRQMSQNLTRNILPSIRQNAMAGGVVGGSRQGVAEGLAIGDTQNAYGNALSGLYANQFNQDRNYGLQSDALDLNVYNANQGWMRQGQQDQISLANNMLNWNQQGINNSTNVQNTPMNYWQQFMNGATQAGGQGGTTGQNQQGNPWLGALGGYNLFSPKG